MTQTSYSTIIARFVATAGGAGYSPIAPGTCGTAVAVPLTWALSHLSLWAFLGVSVGVTIIGIWAASVADRSWGTHDSGRIVIDEVAGYMVTMLFVDRTNWVLLVLGFVIFRVFDIVKPFPVRWLDRHVSGGTGVVLDDVATGMYGCALLYGLSHMDFVGQIGAWQGM